MTVKMMKTVVLGLDWDWRRQRMSHSEVFEAPEVYSPITHSEVFEAPEVYSPITHSEVFEAPEVYSPITHFFQQLT